jgi:hypothetical protein
MSRARLKRLMRRDEPCSHRMAFATEAEHEERMNEAHARGAWFAFLMLNGTALLRKRGTA